MSWEKYFEYDAHRDTYRYKDHDVVALPSDLPQPPITSMRYLFNACCSLQDITALAKWDVSNVKDMSYMFRYCRLLEDITALANWDVSNVADMSGMFASCYVLQDITALTNWEVSNVKDMSGMFRECHSLQNISPLSSWDVPNVTNTYGMFYNCYANVDITPALSHMLGQRDNNNWHTTGSSAILFRREIDELKAQIIRLEERIAELTKSKEETASGTSQ
jgi:surface protein